VLAGWPAAGRCLVSAGVRAPIADPGPVSVPYGMIGT
jgi:hypothetical protein